ncbi:solute carrier family 35 member F2-like isoform X3 [Abrus precatorius]|uniref:Solute carrier family 35 member F2-like isoform X3 n=1 Tax=Abrus precatorius TaxID=3816 RepID=A0A8B8L5R7_ABRPR|nr:solute carrier family 35 member F2-like isoform X3 [Abrus precatorius]
MDWLAMRRCSRTSSTFKVLRLLLLGQLVSLSTVFMSLTTSIITQVLGVDAPLTQSLFTYASLALVFGSILLYRRHKPLISWYWYVPLAFADVQGNYLVNKAYQYTSITSVTLLDCWTIPWAIILTWIFLGTRYSLWQLSGASMCVLGLCLVLLSDSWVGGGDGSRPILGDVLVIVGTFFYGTSNVGEVLSFLGYALSSFMFYSIAPFVLKMSGATMFNLSLLTSDMWAVVFRVFLYHQKVDWLYFLAFAIVGIGLVIYSLVEKDSVPAPTTEDDNLDTEYQMIYDESTPSGNDSRG